MEVTNLMRSFLTESAQKAIEEERGNSAIGGSFDVAVNDVFTLGKIDIREMWAKPRDMKDAEWNVLNDDDRKEQGRHTEWYVIETDKGDMPLSMLLRPHTGVKWTAGKVDDKTFSAKTRKPLAFIAEYGKYFGGKGKCVASADVTNERFGNTVKHRAFQIEEKQS